MGVAVFVGKNHPDSSLYFVAKTLVDRIAGAKIVSKPSDLGGCNVVLNIDVSMASALMENRRYTGYSKLVNLLAGNFEELPLHKQFELVGQSLTNPMVVHSRNSHDQFLAFARKYLSPSTSRVLLESLHLCLYGIEDSFQPSVGSSPENFIVPYNRVNQSQKRIAEHIEATQAVAHILSARGKKTDHLFIASKEVTGQKDRDLSMYRLVPQPPTRDEYRELIQDRGIFICTSKFESFGIYYLELLCSGVVGVFLDAPWVRTLLPGYPFIADKSQLVGMVLAVYKDYKKARRLVIEKTIPYIRDTYSLDRFASEVQAICDLGVPQLH